MLLDNLIVKMSLQADDLKRGIGIATDASLGFFDKVKSKVDDQRDPFRNTIGFLADMGDTMGLIGLAAGAFGQVKDAVLGMNASLESTTLQFATLMGDADLAKEHVKGLFEFAKATPFETEPIIAASRHFQVFGGAALNTHENLKLMGDATAAVNADFERVGFWTGRLYNALEAGKPFGEAAQELMTMGIASPKVIEQMQKMQEQGKSGAEIWRVWQSDMQRFDGAMIAQSTTFSGMASTLSDQLAMLGANAFKPFFDIVVKGLTWITTNLGSDAFNSWVTAFSGGLANLISGSLSWFINTGLPALSAGFNFAYDIVTNYLIPALRAISPSFDTVMATVEKVLAIWERFTFTLGATGSITTSLSSIRTQLEGMGPAGQFLANIIPYVNTLIHVVQDLWNSFVTNFGPIIPLVERAIEVWNRTGSITTAIRDFINNLSNLGTTGANVETILEALGTFISGTLVPTTNTVIQVVKDVITNFGLWNEKGGVVTQSLGGVKDIAVGLIAIVSDLTSFVKDNVAAQAILVGILTALAAKYAITTAASLYHAAVTKGTTATTWLMNTAQSALNVVLSANPIGLVIMALAGLAAGLVYAYNNSETFRRYVDLAWEAVKNFAIRVVQHVGELRAAWNRDFETMRLAISVAANFLRNIFEPALRGVVNAFNWVNEKIQAFKNKLDNIKNSLPDWLTPGSPTPMENGLRGISDAFKDVNDKDIPRFKALLELLEKVPAMEIIDQFMPPTQDALNRVADSVVMMVNTFSVKMKGIKLKTLEGISEFTEGAGKVVELFGKASENFNKASTYTGVFEDTLESISDRIAQVTNFFTEKAKDFNVEMLGATSIYADAAGKSADAIGKAVDNFSKVKDYGGVNYDIVWNLARDIEKTVDIMHLVASNYSTEMLIAAGAFSESSGKVMGLVKDAVEGFEGVNEYRGTAPDMIWALAQDISKATELMIIIAANADKEGIEAASWFATSVKAVFELFKIGVEALDALRDYQSVPRERMAAVLADFELALALMMQITSRADIAGIKIASEFALAAKAIFDLFKAGTDAMDGLRKYESVPRERMQAFFNDFMIALTFMIRAKEEGEMFANEAKEWANKMADAYEHLKKGVDFVNDINNLPEAPDMPMPGKSARAITDLMNKNPDGLNRVASEGNYTSNSKTVTMTINQKGRDEPRRLKTYADAWEMALGD